MGHKRNLSDDGIKSLSNKKSVSDMLKSLNNPPTALKDEGKDAGVNSHSEGKGDISDDENKTNDEVDDFSENEAIEELKEPSLPLVDFQYASPKNLRDAEDKDTDHSDKQIDQLPSGHWILSSPFAAAAVAVAAPSSSAGIEEMESSKKEAKDGICHGQGACVHIVDDVVLYKDDAINEAKRPRVSQRQSCEAKLEIAATGEIGVMLWARMKIGGPDAVGEEYTLRRHAWVRKGRCLGRMVRELLKGRVVMSEVYWYRRYYWRKWETAGFDGDLFWKSFASKEDYKDEHVEFRDLEEDDSD